MHKQTAIDLEIRIQQEDPQCTTDLRRYDDGSWAVNYTDSLTGYSVVINNPAEWDERVKAAEFGSTVDHLD